jgi:hypothetical protein
VSAILTILDYPATGRLMVLFAVVLCVYGCIAYTVNRERRELDASARRGVNARRRDDAWSEYHRLAAHKTTVYFEHGKTTFHGMIGRLGANGDLYLVAPDEPVQLKGGAFCITLSRIKTFAPGAFKTHKVVDGDGWEF